MIRDGFADYNGRFREITRRARIHFEQRDWHASARDARRRIRLYDVCLREMRAELSNILGDRLRDNALWASIKIHYEDQIDALIDRELNKTWFNSVSRRTFQTVGVNHAVEFVETDRGPTDHIHQQVSIRRYSFDGGLGKTCRRILENIPLAAAWKDCGGCAAFLHQQLSRQLAAKGGTGAIEFFEFADPLFFRGIRTCIVGRLILTDDTVPLVIVLMHPQGGLIVDRVLTSEDAVSVMFSYSRSYFHADLATVGDTVVFLKKLLPRKPVEELYASLGRAKQAKTERYRSIRRHLDRVEDRFIVAPGTKGMVMAVFALEKLDVVFKVIRDRFAPPKKVTHEQVKASYRYVHMHDRAGRMVDAQEFRRLRYPLELFADEVRDELLEECAKRVHTEDGYLVLEHCYIERKLTPLNLWLHNARAHDRRRIIDDYGRAIRDLAQSNIFPGDLLLKNFGVSRVGRVIFYDYDELRPMTELNFRAMPRARDDVFEMSSEVWFEVGEDDVFPEQFPSFLGLQGEDLEWFRHRHKDLLHPKFWHDVAAAIEKGTLYDVPPYSGGRIEHDYLQ